jgi:hypothetical protein
MVEAVEVQDSRQTDHAGTEGAPGRGLIEKRRRAEARLSRIIERSGV